MSPMELGEPISDHVMVLAFLQAEVDSHIYGPTVQHFLERRGCNRTLIDNANLSDATENQLRREVLSDVRGYGSTEMLFTNLPADIVWRRARLTVEELGRMKYAGWREWVTLTHGTRLVAEGAKNASNPFYASDTIRAHVAEIAAALRAGNRFAELILVAKPESTELVLVEGHKRATAYLIELDPEDELDVIIGTSENIEKWKGWRPFLTL